jgi:hypothetical protein
LHNAPGGEPERSAPVHERRAALKIARGQTIDRLGVTELSDERADGHDDRDGDYPALPIEVSRSAR